MMRAPELGRDFISLASSGCEGSTPRISYYFPQMSSRLFAHALRAASVAAAAGLSARFLRCDDTLREHRTGQRFDMHRSIQGSTTHLVGCNVRCMLGWCRVPIARAYAFGLYLDDDALLSLRRADSSSEAVATAEASQVVLKPSLVASLLDTKVASPGDFSLAVVLVMARDIDGEHLAHGFQNSVLNRIKVQPGGVKMPGVDSARIAALASGRAASVGADSKPASSSTLSAPLAGTVATVPSTSSTDPLAELNSLVAAFNGRSFKTGDEVVLLWDRDAAVKVSVLQRSQGVAAEPREPQLEPLAIASHPRIARALFDVYCGDSSPVSARAWKTFNSNLARIAVGEVSGAKAGSVDADAVAKIVIEEHASRTK